MSRLPRAFVVVLGELQYGVGRLSATPTCSPPIQARVGSIAPTVKPGLVAIAPAIQLLGAALTAGRFGAVAASVQALIRALAAAV